MGRYVTVSTKVRREILEKARALDINISKFLREKLEEEVRKREAELMMRKLDELSDVLSKIDIERVVASIREDREGR